MVEIIYAAEEEFGVSIPDEEAKNLKRWATRSPTSSVLPPDHHSADHVGPAPRVAPTSQTIDTHRRSHAMSRIRVVVTGLGATTPLGGDVRTTWDGLLAGKSGVRRIEADWAADLPVKIAAQAAVDPAEILERVEARQLDRSAATAGSRRLGGLAGRRIRAERTTPSTEAPGRRHRHWYWRD